MRIRVLGLGLYGAHLALHLSKAGHDVEAHEIADRVFAGATGNIPARLHLGPHYPRSKLTREACGEHYAEFMAAYGDYTHGIACNIYAVAAHDSLVDFGTYRQILRDEIEFITVERPNELGLEKVEGALLTGERHVLTDKLAYALSRKLTGIAQYGRPPGIIDDDRWDVTIDCTACANDGLNVDRYEACLTVLLEGPTDKAITIVDGRFPSLYPWDEERGISSLTSAQWTPMHRCTTWGEAKDFINGADMGVLNDYANPMVAQIAGFYPRFREEYRVVDYRTSIRAMPRSAADARLVDVVRVGERAIRIRAGKLDAIFHAARVVEAMLSEFER